MTSWIAVSYGALDVEHSPAFADDVECLVTPVIAREPMALFGEGAALWRRLVAEGPVDDDALNESERQIVREMAEIGIASADGAHPARQVMLSAPWMSSPLHELVYALVASVARDAGIDAVFIKGPILHLQGLREREHSGDVDVWVDPAAARRLTDALHPWGWERQPEVWGDIAINHSVTARPTAGWGCEVDVHRRFPGISLDERAAFRALRAMAVEQVFAGVRARVPSVEANAVLGALHELRPEIGVGTPTYAEDRAEAYLRTPAGDVVPTAFALGAAAALQPVLRRLAPADEFGDRILVSDSPRDWYWRGSSSKAAAYLTRFGQVPWSQRPGLLWRILWPSREAALESDRLANGHARTVSRARWNRFVRGVRGYIHSWKQEGPR